MKRLYSCTLLIAVSAAFLLYPVSSSADFLSIPAAALFPKDMSVIYSTDGVSTQLTAGDIGTFSAPVILPYNAIIKSFTLEACDDSAHVTTGGYVQARLLEFRYDDAPNVIEAAVTDQQTAPGNIRVTIDDVDFQIDNSDYSYGMEVMLVNGDGGPGSVSFYKAIIEYDVPLIVIQGTPPP